MKHGRMAFLGMAALVTGVLVGVLTNLIGDSTDTAGALTRAATATFAREEVSEEDAPRDLILVYIGSSTCGPSNSVALPSMVEAIRASMAPEAIDRGARFRTIGIAKDGVVDRGIAHLTKFKPFNEVSAGGGWGNVALRHFVYEDVPGLPATPQIVVVERTYEVSNGRPQRGAYSDRLVRRAVGLKEISRLAGRT